jgi:ABC-type nitrate/sulfonate/bicarbonate transport system permease component
LAIWQIASTTGTLNDEAAPPPASALAAFGHLVRSAAFWSSAGATMRAWSLGVAMTILIGVPLGVVLGARPNLWRWCRPTIEAIRPIPPVVVLPLAILVLGAGFSFTAVLIAQGAVWPLLIMTRYGVTSVPTVTLETAQIFRINLWRRLVFVRLGQAVPLLGSGLRIAAGSAFAIAIMAGLVGGGPGLGQNLTLASQANDLPLTFALTIAVGLFGLVILLSFGALERRVTRWRVDAQ